MLQAHFAKFTGRDAAMSKSLNSDYLSQLYIRADTKSMDREFVKAEVETSGLPEEARALVVFKRGYASVLSRFSVRVSSATDPCTSARNKSFLTVPLLTSSSEAVS